MHRRNGQYWVQWSMPLTLSQIETILVQFPNARSDGYGQDEVRSSQLSFLASVMYGDRTGLKEPLAIKTSKPAKKARPQ
jgi:hypothetical protein